MLIDEDVKTPETKVQVKTLQRRRRNDQQWRKKEKRKTVRAKVSMTFTKK